MRMIDKGQPLEAAFGGTRYRASKVGDQVRLETGRHSRTFDEQEARDLGIWLLLHSGGEAASSGMTRDELIAECERAYDRTRYWDQRHARSLREVETKLARAHQHGGFLLYAASAGWALAYVFIFLWLFS